MFLYIYSPQIIFEVIYIFVKMNMDFFIYLSFINRQSRIIGYKYEIKLMKYSFYKSRVINSSQNVITKKQLMV